MTVLRPHYTEHIYKELQKQSLNVHGSQGQGRERLLEDLQVLIKANTSLVLQLNMKSYARSYRDFTEELNALIAESNHQKTFLLLHNFDAVLDNTMLGSGYDVSFFDQLNSFKNRVNCSLLCITEKPYLHYRFYSEKIHRLSPLSLEIDKLTPLSFNEIRADLEPRPLELSEDNLNLLIQTINLHEKPYDFLEYACNRLDAKANRELPFNKQLKLWNKDLKTQNRRGLLWVFDCFQNFVNRLVRELQKLSKTMKLLLSFLSSSVAACAIYIERILDYFGY